MNLKVSKNYVLTFPAAGKVVPHGSAAVLEKSRSPY